MKNASRMHVHSYNEWFSFCLRHAEDNGSAAGQKRFQEEKNNQQ